MDKRNLFWSASVETESGVKGFEGVEELNTINHITKDLPAGKMKSVTASLTYRLEEGEKVFMNGYQTWTECHEYTKDESQRGLHRVPQKVIDQYSFDRYGDYHFVDYPFKKGLTHGFSWCCFRKGKRFRLFASMDERPGYTIFRYDANAGILSIERDCAGVNEKGSYPLFDLYVKEGSEEEVYDGWFEAMELKRRPASKLAGYSSWYNRYQNIDEAAILQDLNGCDKILRSGDLFQIDDGWEPFIGDWLEPDENKFKDMKAMADEAHEKGYLAGLWLAPFSAEEKSSLYQNHQDWFLKVNGENWKDGCNWSGFYSLDIDHPEVKKYLKAVFDRVHNEWGFDLVKLDFLYSAAPFGNERESRAGRMYRAVEMLREWCGDMMILGCGVPVMPAFGYFEYCRVSCDVSLDWDDKVYMRAFHRERTSTKNAVTTVVSRRQLNSRAYLSDPDVFFLRDDNLKLSKSDRYDLAVMDALLGGLFLTSDDPSSYTEEMVEEYNEVRKLMDAEDIEVSTDNGLKIRCISEGRIKDFELFTAHKDLKV